MLLYRFKTPTTTPPPSRRLLADSMLCCCNQTKACGLVKNLALMAYISVGSADSAILEFLEEFNTENLEVRHRLCDRVGDPGWFTHMMYAVICL
jgi:hypothetical protein